MPAPGDAIDVDGLRLTVETTDGRRVGKVLVTRQVDRPPRDSENGEDDAAGRGQRARKAATKSKR